MMKRVLVLALLLVARGATARADDWPQWRGVARDGTSRETGLSREWPSDGPPLVWRAQGLGEGYSTPSVARGHVYALGDRDGQEWLFSLDEATGAPRWETAIGAVRGGGSGYPGPRSTPTVDGERVFALGLNGDLIAASASDGEILWRGDLVADFGGVIPSWGYSESVLVDKGRLVCTPGGGRATIVALLAASGKTVWESALGDGAGYSSIVAATLASRKQYVQFTDRGLVAVDVNTGAALWRYDAPANMTANVATPLVTSLGVFAASGYGAGGGLVKIGRRGAKVIAAEAFFTREMKNHHGGFVALGKHLFGCDDPGVLTCLDLTNGKTTWRERSAGKCSVSLVDGMLICRGEDGRVSLVEADGQAFRLLSGFEETNRSGKQTWPHPVIANGRLYLRDQDSLTCYELRDER